MRANTLMHELGVTQEIVEIACGHAAGGKIKRIVLEIGKLAAVLPDAMPSRSTSCPAAPSAGHAAA